MDKLKKAQSTVSEVLKADWEPWHRYFIEMSIILMGAILKHHYITDEERQNTKKLIAECKQRLNEAGE